MICIKLFGVVFFGNTVIFLILRHFFIEKYGRDVKQGQKITPDLVESIIRPTHHVKEELWRILFKLIRFRSKIHKTKACTFWMSGKITDSRRRPTQPASLVSFEPIMAPQT